jgi:L-2-hydroxyglutarate oxidase LhgO
MEMAGNRLEVITSRSVNSVRSSAAGAASSAGRGDVAACLDDGAIIPCTHVFNCAGTGALALAKSSGFGSNFLELPFRGMYFKVKGFAPKRLLYPVPDLSAPFLGVHWTVDAHGGAKLGPSAMFTLTDAHFPAPAPSFASIASNFGNLMAFLTKQPKIALEGVVCGVWCVVCGV